MKPNLNGIEIKKLESRSTKFKQTPFMKQGIIPKTPSSWVLIGGTGSGKSTALANILLNPDFMGNYFKPENSYCFGHTCKSDDLWRTHLKDQFPEDNIVDHDMDEILGNLIANRVLECDEKGPERTEPICVVFEDVTANRKLMNSPGFIKCFVQNRHYNITVLACAHKYKALTRVCRLSAHALVIYPCPVSDIKAVLEDHHAPGLTTKQMRQVIEFAFQQESASDRPFLFINTTMPYSDRYRKRFDLILSIKGKQDEKKTFKKETRKRLR